MDCERFREQLPEFLADAVAPAERAAVEAHARDCATCAAELAGHRATWEALGVLEPVDAIPTARLDAMAATALARARQPEVAEPPVGVAGTAIATATSTATSRVLPLSRARLWATRLAAAAVLIAGTALATRWWLLRDGALPGFLDEADFVTHFELLQELPALDGQGDLLDLDDELTALDALVEG